MHRSLEWLEIRISRLIHHQCCVVEGIPSLLNRLDLRKWLTLIHEIHISKLPELMPVRVAQKTNKLIRHINRNREVKRSAVHECFFTL